jgi:hypothetical protein
MHLHCSDAAFEFTIQELPQDESYPNDLPNNSIARTALR